jgi:hypothetical protein
MRVGEGKTEPWLLLCDVWLLLLCVLCGRSRDRTSSADHLPPQPMLFSGILAASAAKLLPAMPRCVQPRN